MKKVLTTLLLVCFAMAANAQFVVSLDASFQTVNANTVSNATLTVPTDSSYSSMTAKNGVMGYGFGLSAGYQFGKARVGLGGGYSSNSATTYTFDESIPNLDEWQKITTTNFFGKLYFRYDVVQLGDISVFAQLDAQLTISPNAKYHIYTNHEPVPGTENFTSWDTTYNAPTKATSISVSLVPGVSWQISPVCSLDLYIDLLKIGYYYTKTTTHQDITVLDEKVGEVDNVTTDSKFAFGCEMSAKTLYDDLSIFRLGFNLTF